MTENKALIILIAGPFRSGTNDDPKLIAKNLDRLEHFALQVYQAGHIPMIGEWVALPLMKQAGSRSLSDPIAEQYLYPVASRLIDRCDAVFRIEGESKGAEEDVRLARQRGLPVYQRIEEIPVRRELASMTAWGFAARAEVFCGEGERDADQGHDGHHAKAIHKPDQAGLLVELVVEHALGVLGGVVVRKAQVLEGLGQQINAGVKQR